MKILLIGDVVGKGGQKAVRHLLPRVVDEEAVDLTVANVENLHHGLGVTREAVEEIKKSGVQVMTSGNHIWKRPGTDVLLEQERFLLRPANYPPGTSGRGFAVWESNTGVRVGVMCLLGRVFMEPLDCPFRISDQIVREMRGEGVRVILVDFHAEATSEKAAFGWHMDGRVSAVLGTHTHVQTADERILPHGTGFITDVGMTGGQDSVIGVKTEPSVTRFLTGIHQRLEPSSRNLMLHGVVLDICEKRGVCRGLRRIRKGLDNRP